MNSKRLKYLFRRKQIWEQNYLNLKSLKKLKKMRKITLNLGYLNIEII